MKARQWRLGLLAGTGCLLCAAWLAADTLVLRSGKQIEGELVGATADSIEFREASLFGGGRVKRYNRSDVRGIELDADSEGSSSSTPSSEGLSQPSRPRGLREKSVTVSASVPWTETNIEVRSGQPVYFEASGKVRWGKDRRDGPDGEGGNHSNPNRPIPNRPGAALIGKVGEGSRDYFFIGSDQSPIRMRASGRLYLGINDDFLPDNSGFFSVSIYY